MQKKIYKNSGRIEKKTRKTMDSEEGGTTKRGRGRGRAARGRAASTRARGRGRGRGRKAKVIESDEEASPEQPETEDVDASIEEKPVEPEPVVVAPAEPATEEKENEIVPPTSKFVINSNNNRNKIYNSIRLTVDMEADISQLEAPTFTTISRGPPEPMLRLKWDHKVSLIGEKVLNPMIHCCDLCDKPILIYGRMIPCKHVFCLRCARSEPFKACPRCKEKVLRVEQSGLGTVFMCTYGGSRYGNTGCRRTYLSQRDLQAHINHRHITSDGKGDGGKTSQRKGSISSDSIPQSPFGQQAVSSPLNLSQSATAHNLSTVASSTSYYSSFSQYGSMQTHSSHYSSASRNVNYDSSSHKSNLDPSRR